MPALDTVADTEIATSNAIKKDSALAEANALYSMAKNAVNNKRNGQAAEGLPKTIDIHEGINQVRLHECRGETSLRPLLASPELEIAAQRRADGQLLGEALSDFPGAFSYASILVVGGDAKTALSRLAIRHCDKLADSDFTHIGVVFDKNRWWIALGSKASESTEFTELDGPPVVASGEYAEVLVARINATRNAARTCGKRTFQAAAPVAWNRHLTEAAKGHAADMVRRRYFDHVSPDGQSVADRVHAARYHFSAVGENIAAVPAPDPTTVIDEVAR